MTYYRAREFNMKVSKIRPLTVAIVVLLIRLTIASPARADLVLGFPKGLTGWSTPNNGSAAGAPGTVSESRGLATIADRCHPRGRHKHECVAAPQQRSSENQGRHAGSHTGLIEIQQSSSLAETERKREIRRCRGVVKSTAWKSWKA